MMSVEEARAFVLGHVSPLEPERVPILDARDRVLTEDIVSELESPPAIILPKGARVGAEEIGLLAALGRTAVNVHRRPKVAILATGDELVEIDEPVTPGKIRNSNAYSNAAAVLKAGGVPFQLGIARDEIDDLTGKIRAGLDVGADLLITCGGTSRGDFDLVKDVLKREGKMHFWQVAMKPGKSLAFGTVGGVPVLGLPGNPGSTMVTFELFARPAILAMLGKTSFERPDVRARLEDQLDNTGGLRSYVAMRVERVQDEYVARTTRRPGSGALSSMVESNGLLAMPGDCVLLERGKHANISMLDWPEDV
jgi:molybdopterin molybdotransferase